MTAKKRAAPRKAMPVTWNLEQLDEELRVALALTKRPGLVRYGDSTPMVVTQRRERSFGRGTKKRVEYEDAPWTDAQRATIQTTMENHVAAPLWGERTAIRVCRLYLDEAAPTAGQTVTTLKALIRIVRNEVT